ncbi:MAG: hypothetical protein TREMPRED_004378, partial [Tremellales sp. Tagirdzhanova-0007]
MLLKRIAALLPAHLNALIPTLEAANIRTTESLLFTTSSKLLEILPTVSEADFDDLVAHCLSVTAPRGFAGHEGLKDGQRAEWSGFGVDGVDQLFGDPWDGVGIVEISGMRRVGKSLLALHAALRGLVSDEMAICHWLDSDGSFSPKRARAILEFIGVEDVKGVLDRLVVSHSFRLDPDVHDALAILQNEMEGLEADRQSQSTKRTRILVIDPITNLFKDTLMNTSAQVTTGHAEMITIMEEIAELTYSMNLLTIVTNSTASSLPTNPLSTFSATTIKPALGLAFTFCADISLLVQESGRLFGLVDEEERERVRKRPGLRGVVEVVKTRIATGGKWAVFETDGTRLYDVAPPPTEDERTIRMSAGLPTGVPRPAHGPLKRTMIP